MKLFVGLGNPGDEYSRHRHNVGFMALERIAGREARVAWRNKFHGQVADIELAGVKSVLLKPMTFMNDSGRSVGEAARFYKIAPEDIVVFHDEIDLAPGKVRVKTGGGVAGHNGLKSIGAHLGHDFCRVRIGVGHPGHKDKVSGYVLHGFSKTEFEWLEPLLDKIADAAPLLAQGKDANFMNAVAGSEKSAKGDRNPRKKAPPAEKTKKTSRDVSDQPKTTEGALAHLLARLLGTKDS